MKCVILLGIAIIAFQSSTGLTKVEKRLEELEMDVKRLKVQNPVGNCRELSTIGVTETKKYPITVNGMSFEATCDMTSKMTTFEPTSKEIAILETPVPTDREYDIQYEATTSQIDSVIQSSPACSQSLTFHCSNEATSWKNPYNHKTLLVIKRKDGSYIKPQDTDNYNGAKMKCITSGHPAAEDTFVIKDKNSLPIQGFKYGIHFSYHDAKVTIGSVQCEFSNQPIEPKKCGCDKGEKGDTGATGSKGDKGDKGDKGEKGDTGASGSKGPAGQRGDTGATGSRGPTGQKGPTGVTGPRGLRGQKGEGNLAGTIWFDAIRESNVDASSTWTKITYTNVRQSTNYQAMNKGTGVFTAPLAGTYQFFIQVWKWSSVDGNVKIVLDGTTVSRIYDGDDSHYTTLTGTAIIEMQPGQKAWAETYNKLEGYSDGRTHFSGVLITPK